MTTQALLEVLPDNRYRVTGCGRFAVSGEGKTPDEAVAAFRQATKRARVLTVELSDPDNATVVDEVSPDTWNEFLALIQSQRNEDNSVFGNEEETV